MSTKIEFHLLQSFPPANLNRDDTNTPKDCEFGGVRRARISSQCSKRTIRFHPDFAQATGVELAERTRLLAAQIKDNLVALGKPVEEAQKVANAFIGALLGGMDNKKTDQTKVLFYISAEEKASIAECLTVDWQASLKGNYEDMVKEYKKTFATRSSAPDIALFGRMLADDPALSLDAACQMAHAISTHKVNMEMDFYTAVDDLQKEEETGAGMMGITGFNSATFYRYAAIDWDQLVRNLGDNAGLARKTVLGFLRAAAKAIPTGKQNSFAAQTPPGFVLVVVRSDGQAWSLANAFEKPVFAPRKDGGYLQESIKALVRHWSRLNKVYGNPEKPVKAFALALEEDISLEPLHGLASLAELEEKALAALPKE
jgi:CRISPR system Cascade subunit CasC